MKWSLVSAVLSISALLIWPNSTKANSGDFAGGVAIGTSYAGIVAAPTNGIIVQGKLGIGTTSPTASLTAYSSSNAGVNLSLASLGDTTNYWLIGKRGSTFSGAANNFFLSYFDGSAFSEAMDVTSTGAIGIGTTVPAQKLDVLGNIAFRYGDGIFTNNVTYNNVITTGWNGSADTLNLFTPGNGASDATARVVILSSGKVGIGTTSPQGVLTSYVPSGYIESLTQSGTDKAFIAQDSTKAYVGTYSNAPLVLYTNGSEKMRITASGSVGIGTTSPTTMLHVYVPSGYVESRLQTGTNSALFGQDSSNTYVGTYANTPLLLYTNGSEKVRISTAGNVGIGTVSPSYLLHVGNTSATGIVMELQNSSGACTYNPGASSVTVSCSSDAKLKTDIKDYSNALSWIGTMRIRDFTVKRTGERKTGVIAQEMLLDHPGMVHKDANGTYLVDEPNPWKLIKAIQEQQAEIEELKKEIVELKQK